MSIAKKFLIINPFGIGDVLFTTPVISNLRESFPDCFIGYWCNKRISDILINNKDIQRIFALSRGDLKKNFQISKIKALRESFIFFKQLKKEHFDVSIDYSLDHRYALIAKLAGIKKRIGFDYKGRGRFLTDKIKLEGYSKVHVVDYYLELLSFLGITAKKFNLKLTLGQNCELIKKKIFEKYEIKEGDTLVGISCGGGISWGKDAVRKHWPVEKFAQLADDLISNYKLKILLLGDSSDSNICEQMLSKMRARAINLAGKLSLIESLSLISALQLLITNDSGLLHAAVSLGTKTISFFGPVDPLVYGPYPLDNLDNVFFRAPVECSPCYKNFRLNACLNEKKCLNDIRVKDVFEAVGKILLGKEESS